MVMASRQPSSIGQPVLSKHLETKRQSIPKRKEKGSDVEVKDKLPAVELEKFCPQKIFNVLFLNETDEYSKGVLRRIIDTSKEFEEISYLTFISYEDVINLAKNCDIVVLPPLIKSLLKLVSRKVYESLYQQEAIPLDVLAQLVKLKLVEVMYIQYVTAVTKMQQRRKLMADLKTLADECRQDRYKEKSPKGKADSKINTSNRDLAKKSKMPDTKDIVDYTTVPIQTDDDIVFDDDIHHHVSFYVFTGFYDSGLLKKMIVNNNMAVQTILKFTAETNEEKPGLESSSIYSDFWDNISKYFDGPERQEFTENTFLMTYTTTGTDSKQMLEELLSVVRNTSEIKLQHLNYIRHMEVLRYKDVYNFFPLECLTVYNNFLQKIPVELVNIPVLLDSLLKQVCVSVDETLSFTENISQHSYFESNNIEKNRCINPCSFEAFLKRKTKARTEPGALKRLETSFLVHENDELTLILNSYKKYGSVVHDTTVKILKYVKPLKEFSECEVDYTDIIHKHDRDPSTATIIKNKDTLAHFLYLFLFSCFGYNEVLPKLEDNDLARNLESYRKLDFINLSRPKIIKSDVINVNNEEEVCQDNLYEIAVTEYFWKEKLEPTVLLQEIYKSYNEYLYCNQRYSPETDTLLIQFTNGLNEFGMNTKIYDQPLLTTVCLRDFCRYDILQQSEWLEKNKPPKYVRKCVVKEQCQGALKVTSLNLFPEYHYLLETGVQMEPETDRNQVNNTDYEQISFDHLVNEIKYYPSNTKLIKECMKVSKHRFFVYDLGTKYFHVKGAKTTFQSHDDVTISVDNTRFLEEYPKCSVTLSCRNNSLVLHSGKFYLKQDYIFHMNIADGTIISYAFSRHKKAKTPKKYMKEPSLYTDKLLLLDKNHKTADIEYEEIVRSVDREYFESVVKTGLLNEEFDGSERIIYKSSESVLGRLKEAATTNIPIYKVNSNLTYLKKLKSEFEIPLSNIVRRVLHTTIHKEDIQSFTRRYLPVDERSHETEKTSDIRIALPNGLYITFYPSQLKKGYLEVKQEFLNHNASTEEEEFRLFTRGGYNLIKRIDGCITTLKSNGDSIKHEKLNSEDIHTYAGPCHCKTMDDYIKRVNKMFKYANDEISFFAVSRRAHLQTRKGNVDSPDTIDILMNNKIPYLKNTLLKFDGSRVCLRSGKVKIKKVLHTSFENNFPEQEIYYERSDGFKSTFDKNGSQMVEFMDGTRITSSVYVEKKLVDGYVYISLQFKFEHPNYATVVYTPENDLEIHLNNNVVFKLDLENSSLRIDEDVVTTVDRNKILFEKSCGKCSSKYTCDIDISPLVTGEISFPDRFVHAQDSYNKHFYCDFAGNCERNEDYIKGPFNSSNCKHYNCMLYKKLFVVNRDFSGHTFWTDNMVLTKKKAMVGDPHIILTEYNDKLDPKIHVYKFKKQMFDHYCSRFLTRDPLDSKQSIYSTFCVVKRMIEDETLQKFYEDLAEYFLKPENCTSPYYNVLQQMMQGNKIYQQRDNEIVVETIKQVVVQVEKCKCVQEKISISDKIEIWRNECRKYRALLRNPKIPCYFDSPFCKIIKKK